MLAVYINHCSVCHSQSQAAYLLLTLYHISLTRLLWAKRQDYVCHQLLLEGLQQHHCCVLTAYLILHSDTLREKGGSEKEDLSYGSITAPQSLFIHSLSHSKHINCMLPYVPSTALWAGVSYGDSDFVPCPVGDHSLVGKEISNSIIIIQYN